MNENGNNASDVAEIQALDVIKEMQVENLIADTMNIGWSEGWLACGILALLALVFFGYPFFLWVRSCIMAWRQDEDHRLESIKELRGLALPRGSIRAMLAIAIVGSFLIYLVFGDNNTNVITAFGTLSGAVTGFYFGGRASATQPASQPNPSSTD